MFLQQPSPTGYEINFRLFRIPVQIHPFFFIVALVLIGQFAILTPNGIKALNLVCALVLFLLSILVHELGHSAAMAYYGIGSRIVLYAFGGMAIPTNRIGRNFRNGMWDQVIIAAAGPAAQFLLLGLVLGVLFFSGVAFRFEQSLLFVRFEDLGWVWAQIDWGHMLLIFILLNTFWPLFNLLPIFPLDGGQICRGVCRNVQGSHSGLTTSLWISVITGTLLAVYFFQQGMLFNTFFLGYLTYQSVQELQASGGW